ncbi:MAG: permease [Gemmataceae bacterium]|nr:permease [Gemmataceae bacterium]
MDPTLLDFLLTFSAILWEAMPFIVIGALVAGVLEEFLPQQFITRVLPSQLLPSVMMGAVLGLIFPMCECGIVVVMRRLLRKGLPLACCVAYLLAGPIINLVVIFSTWFAFRDHKIGPEMVGLRCGLGFLTAVITALIVHRQYRKYGNSLLTPLAYPGRSTELSTPPTGDNTHSAGLPRRSLFRRLSNISATALHDFVDITVFLILGAVLAAVAKQYVAPDEVERISRETPLLVIGGMMLLAALMCLCSEADAFVAASFTNLHISGKLAFLVYGPMVDIKLMMMYTRIFRPRLIVTILTAVTVQVFVYTGLVHLVYRINGWTGLPG